MPVDPTDAWWDGLTLGIEIGFIVGIVIRDIMAKMDAEVANKRITALETKLETPPHT